jgi:hypothetical protein
MKEFECEGGRWMDTRRMLCALYYKNVDGRRTGADASESGERKGRGMKKKNWLVGGCDERGERMEYDDLNSCSFKLLPSEGKGGEKKGERRADKDTGERVKGSTAKWCDEHESGRQERGNECF